jgi:hypothetical protein
MNDADGPRMAQWFYEVLLENEAVELKHIPYALDAAVACRLLAGLHTCTGGLKTSRYAVFLCIG